MSTQIIQINVSPEELEALLKKTILTEMKGLIQTTIPPQVHEKEFLTRQETIAFFGISNVCLHDWTKQGYFSSYKVGSRLYYRYSELVEKILNNKTNHTNEE